MVVDERDNVLGAGFYNPHARIAVRILEHRRTTDIDFRPRSMDGLLRQRLLAALERRKSLGLPSDETTGFRLCHGEGDLLGGLAVDLLNDVALVHLRSRRNV